MLANSSRGSLVLLRSRLAQTVGSNATRCLADQSSGGNKSTDNKPKQAAKPSKKAATDSCSVPPPAAPAKKQAESLGKPGKPSDKYEAPEYFGYNEYSFNDLISEMEKSRNPQPRPK